MLAKNTCCCTAGRRAPKCSSFAAFAFDLLQIPKQDLYRMRDITHARERVLEALQLPQQVAHMLDLSTQDSDNSAQRRPRSIGSQRSDSDSWYRRQALRGRTSCLKPYVSGPATIRLNPALDHRFWLSLLAENRC